MLYLSTVIALIAVLLVTPAAARASGQSVITTTNAYGCINLGDLRAFDTANAQAEAAHDDAGADNAAQIAMESSCDFIDAGSTGTITGRQGAYVQVQMDSSTEDNWFNAAAIKAR